jgi:hypothetical protein
MERGEGQLHLGLDAHRTRDATSRSALDHVLEERGLADAGFAPDDERRAPAATHRRQQPLELRTFPFSPAKHDVAGYDTGDGA